MALWHSLEVHHDNGTFQVGLMVKNLLGNAGDVRDAASISGWARSSGEGNGNPRHDSYLESRMERGAWQAVVHRVAKSRTWLKGLSTAQWISATRRCCVPKWGGSSSGCSFHTVCDGPCSCKPDVVTAEPVNWSPWMTMESKEFLTASL